MNRSQTLIKLVEGNFPVQDIFTQKFNVVKDVGSIRKKSVHVEDIMDALIAAYDLTAKENATRTVAVVHTFTEQIYSNADGTIGCYYYGGRLGLPTVKIGCADDKLWKQIKTFLAEKGLTR